VQWYYENDLGLVNYLIFNEDKDMGSSSLRANLTKYT